MEDLVFTPVHRNPPPPAQRRHYNVKRPLLVAALVAVVMASLHWPSDFWNSTALTIMSGALCAAVPITLLRRRELRPFWIGFTTIGWLYATMIFGPWFCEYVGGQLLTVKMVNKLADGVEPWWRDHSEGADATRPFGLDANDDPSAPFRIGGFPGSVEQSSLASASPFGRPTWPFRANFYRIGHFWSVLAFAWIAGAVSRWACRETAPQEHPADPASSAVQLGEA
ncbi:MAG TPA: hypothetical protein VGX78_22725 [Pirellulales bacterium]|jgi:hypothetical protein|nr:hypothetical protein [Pirellulales bacterium]